MESASRPGTDTMAMSTCRPDGGGEQTGSRWRRPFRGRLMTSIETPDGAGVPVRAQTRISVSDPKIMVNLLGAGDEILRLIERAMVSDVHVRGNEITITGAPADNARAERLFS